VLAAAGASDTPRILEQRVALAPATVPVSIGPLSGELSNLSVMRRVDASSGSVVYEPQLTGTLVLKNTSEDRAVRLIGGDLSYLGAEGVAIELVDGRSTAFTFPSYSVDRVDPGGELRQSIDVAFPASAFEGGLHELRLALDYVAMPYREDVVTVPVAVGARS
jgi:hypothetical protein